VYGRVPLVASPALVEPILKADVEQVRRPVLGYTMVWTAALLFAVNGTVSKVILESGISSTRLVQARTTGALVLFGLVLALLAPRSLRVTRRELPFLVLFGAVGVAFVQWLYFVAIHRLPVGIALLIQYLAPLLVALWARFAMREPVRRRIWVALALALVGLTLLVEVWEGLTLDGVGVVAALAAALAFALYLLLAERAVGRRDPFSLSLYGFLFAAAFWAGVRPLWTFPDEELTDRASLLGNLADVELPVWGLTAWLVVLGTIVPFGLVVWALRHLPATRVGIVAMLEPLVATLVAWAWLGEELAPVQLSGGAVILAGILLAQTAR
jgi:drug/metabolite transporter (DMT)-like permease